MIYEDMTFENILKRSLDRVSNSLDKRQGSIIYDSTAPAAAELALAYIQMKYIDEKRDAENLSDDELELYINQKTGIERKQATKAIRKGIFSKADGSFFNVDIRSRFTGEESYFIVTEKIADGEFKLECEESGDIGDEYTGRLLPVNYINNLAKAELTDILTPGYNAESDLSLLARYYERIRTPATSGNKYHYKNWAKEVVGVGDAKISPLWNGNGTVKVVIVDSNKNPATEDLITSVFNHIEDNRPIGATVTVVSGVAKNISIAARVNLADGYRIQEVLDQFKAILEKHRKDIAFNDTYISYAKIGSMLLDTSGVLDYVDLKLNGEVNNVALGGEEIPMFDLVELEVI